jgi:hypothetical protein
MFTLGRTVKRFGSGIFVVTLLVSVASAQDCETYDLYGVVTDVSGKTLQGALVEILDIQTRALVKPNPGSREVTSISSGNDGRYSLSVLDLPNIQNGQDFILRVSKSGFVAHEEKINIYYCGLKRDVKIEKSKQSGKAKIKIKRTRKARRR